MVMMVVNSCSNAMLEILMGTLTMDVEAFACLLACLYIEACTKESSSYELLGNLCFYILSQNRTARQKEARRCAMGKLGFAPDFLRFEVVEGDIR